MISIIVPVYNVSGYLNKCLTSISSQTFRDFEVILVDDGSTDDSGEICDEFAGKDERFRAFHKENGGLSDARNYGIEKSKGEYLLFVDSDDFIHLRMLELLYKELCNQAADVVIGQFFKVLWSEVGELKEALIEDYDVEICSGREACKFIFDEKRCLQSVISVNKLYKRELFEEIRFPKGKIHEDEFTSYKLLYGAERVVYVDIPLYFYVQRKGSITREDEYSPNHIVILEMLKERIAFFQEHDDEELLKYAVHRATLSARSLYYSYLEAGNEAYAQRSYEFAWEIKRCYNDLIRFSWDERWLFALFLKNPQSYPRYEYIRNKVRRHFPCFF